MNNNKDNRSSEMQKMLSRYRKANPIYVKSLDDDNSLEEKMKESLNRIGDDDGQSETTINENGGS
jgi:hypothetical protein